MSSSLPSRHRGDWGNGRDRDSRGSQESYYDRGPLFTHLSKDCQGSGETDSHYRRRSPSPRPSSYMGTYFDYSIYRSRRESRSRSRSRTRDSRGYRRRSPLASRSSPRRRSSSRDGFSDSRSSRYRYSSRRRRRSRSRSRDSRGYKLRSPSRSWLRRRSSSRDGSSDSRNSPFSHSSRRRRRSRSRSRDSRGYKFRSPSRSWLRRRSSSRDGSSDSRNSLSSHSSRRRSRSRERSPYNRWPDGYYGDKTSSSTAQPVQTHAVSSASSNTCKSKVNETTAATNEESVVQNSPSAISGLRGEACCSPQHVNAPGEKLVTAPKKTCPVGSAISNYKVLTASSKPSNRVCQLPAAQVPSDQQQPDLADCDRDLLALSAKRSTPSVLVGSCKDEDDNGDDIRIIDKPPTKPPVVVLSDDEGDVRGFQEGDSAWSFHMVTDTLSQAIIAYWLKQRQDPDIASRKLNLRAGLLQIFQNCYPGCMLHLFGSSYNGFDRCGSDVDACLLLKGHKMDGEDWSRETHKKNEALRILRTLKSHLMRNYWFENFKIIPAKVPILCFKDFYGQFDVDINVGNHHGVRNTHFVRLYAYADQRVPILGIIIKQWAKLQGINDASKGTLSSYTLVLMVIRYLQACRPPVIPCIHEKYPESVNLWFSSQSNVNLLIPDHYLADFIFRPTANKQTLGELLVGFFSFVRDFDFRTSYMSIRQARDVSRLGSTFKPDAKVCIEDPLTCLNVAKSVTTVQGMTAIRRAFIRAAEALSRDCSLTAIGLLAH